MPATPPPSAQPLSTVPRERPGSIPHEVLVELLAGRHADPFAWLGPHVLPGGALAVRTLLPGARSVTLTSQGIPGGRHAMQQLHPDGMFVAVVAGASVDLAYSLLVTNPDGSVWESEDAYRFPSSLHATDLYLYSEGTHERAYSWLGATPQHLRGCHGMRFALWAPSAQCVSVVGDFNAWDARRHVMRLHPGAGVWEIFIPGIGAGERYKYNLLPGGGGPALHKADPYAQVMERAPATASVTHTANDGNWNDRAWLDERHARNAQTAPISIYEVHVGSWRRHEDGRQPDWDELADTLVPYVCEQGFTHLQLMPVSEYPFDGSWGYQPVGLYAPTNRFGDPAGLARLVNACHRAGLGVLLDWVPGHFPADVHGLARFDGTCLYEHADPRQGVHPDWDTLIYNYGRREVTSFLLSNAMAWLDRYHIDGLRVDAVASMLYLDYSREAGQWQPNRHGGRENLEAVAFLKDLNTRAYRAYPGIMTVAEESTAWPGVSRPVDQGGLGFGYKWNMGWMNDTLDYFAHDPVHRVHHHQQLTFSLIYAFDENFILPLSHDEVVHGKGSLLGRMPGDRWQKFANLRACLGYMWGHPGKKLLFMGGEFAQEREWNHDRGLDWHLLASHEHRGMQTLVRDLNRTLRNQPALHRLDCDVSGFRWLQANAGAESVLAFLRLDGAGGHVLVVCNFTPVVRSRWRVGVPGPGHYAEIVNTDAHTYGGSNVGNLGGVAAEPHPADGCAWSVQLTLPPLATMLLAPDSR